MAGVFISYAREDQPSALRLYHDLEERGHEPSIDKYNIRPGEAWRQASRRALREASHCIALLSRWSASKRGTFQTEIKEALEVLKEFPQDRIFLIPARLEECEPPAFEMWEASIKFDLFPDYEAGLLAILDVLSNGASRGARPDPEAASALRSFRQGLFEEAARRFSALVKRNPESSEARYYLVLSFLAGKRPRLLSADTVAKLEEHLRIAMAEDRSPHIRLLCALLKVDYYVLNGLQEPPPMVRDLLTTDLRIDCERAAELRTVINAPGNPLWESLIANGR